MEDLRKVEAQKESELKEQMGKAYYRNSHDRFMCRLYRDNMTGRLKEEYKTLKNGTKIHVVFPWSQNRASKPTFREMNLKEIDDWKKAIAEDEGIERETPEKVVVEAKSKTKIHSGKTLKAELNL